MADTPPVTSSAPSTPPSSAAEQARLRKERREAKIRAGGSARLNKITGLGGGLQRDVLPQVQAQTSVPVTSSADDPEEVDISQHFYAPSTTTRPLDPSTLTDSQLRAMMLGFPSGTSSPQPPPNPNAPPNSFTPPPGFDGINGPPSDDPIMKLMAQMMGGPPGEGPNGMPSFPGMPSLSPTDTQADPYAYVWRIVHALFALSLGLYIALTTSFSGTKLERERAALLNTNPSSSSSSSWGFVGLQNSSLRFFYIFATAQVLLQTSRFFLDKGRVQHGGMMGLVVGFLPPTWRAYVEVGMRYARIWTTVSADAMVCLWVLGVATWLKP